VKIQPLTYAIISVMFFHTSCNKGPYPIAGITIVYPNLSNSQSLRVVRTQKNIFSAIIDTLNSRELNQTNNYSSFLEFENESVNYLLFVENTEHIDTISDVIIKRKACKNKIKTVKYRFNGKIQTENELRIE
jgi:hypothetical protein